MVEAFVLINTAAGTSRPLLETMREIENIKQANIVAGEFDVIAIIEVDSPQELLTFITDQIQSIEGVGRTHTNIILE